jgi:hypothetical protein
MSAEVQCSVNNHAAHLVDRQDIIYIGVIRNRSHIDIYLASYNALAYPTIAILKGDDIGIVVVTEEVAVHLAMILRGAKYIVYLASGITLLAYNLLNPTAYL